MATPLLYTLTASARLAYSAIVGGVRRGFSANRIQQILTGAGIGIRRSTLLDVVSATRGILEKGAYLRKLRAGQRFNPVALPEAITQIRRRYSVTVVVKGKMLETDLVTWQHVTLSMDEPMSRDAMEELAMRIVEEGKDRYRILAEAAVIEQGVRWGAPGLL